MKLIGAIQASPSIRMENLCSHDAILTQLQQKTCPKLAFFEPITTEPQTAKMVYDTLIRAISDLEGIIVKAYGV